MAETNNQEPKGFTREVVEFIWETAKVVLIALVIIIPVRYYLVQPFFVKGSSMIPNFRDKEYILVDKLSYRIGRPERGDVVVFRYPDNPQEYFIKRIIGLPGERVVVGSNKITVFNDRYPDGYVMPENDLYLPKENPTYPKGSQTTWDIPEDSYFVMGDNREHSSDSRVFGPVARSYFAGRAWIRLWPLNMIEMVPRVTFPQQ